MEVTAKDLRFKINMLFDVLNKGEDIIPQEKQTIFCKV
jgi:hypothetical protein